MISEAFSIILFQFNLEKSERFLIDIVAQITATDYKIEKIKNFRDQQFERFVSFFKSEFQQREQCEQGAKWREGNGGRAARVTFFSVIEAAVSRASGTNCGCKSIDATIPENFSLVSLHRFETREREKVGVVDDIARTDAGERIASALRNLHRRPDVARRTILKPNPHYNKTRYISKLHNSLETKERNFVQLFHRDLSHLPGKVLEYFIIFFYVTSSLY